MLLIYTGNGKGKTSACVGQAIRAHGQGLRVAFAQFIKQDKEAGEQKMLTQLLGDNMFIGGKGFFTHERQRPKHQQAAATTLQWALARIAHVDMVILDESLYALHAGLITKDALQNIITQTHNAGVHLVLSGRGLPDWLKEQADTVSELLEVKHHMRQGITATKGIEF